MKLMLIFGPQAVGKMTVGEEVAARTGMKLFHNHMTIELVSHFFSYGTETGKRLVHAFREQIFDAVAQSDLEGLIFTYLWAFDMQGDWDAIERVAKKFRDRGAEIYWSWKRRWTSACAATAPSTGFRKSPPSATSNGRKKTF